MYKRETKAIGRWVIPRTRPTPSVGHYTVTCWVWRMTYVACSVIGLHCLRGTVCKDIVYTFTVYDPFEGWSPHFRVPEKAAVRCVPRVFLMDYWPPLCSCSYHMKTVGDHHVEEVRSCCAGGALRGIRYHLRCHSGNGVAVAEWMYVRLCG